MVANSWIKEDTEPALTVASGVFLKKKKKEKERTFLNEIGDMTFGVAETSKVSGDHLRLVFS